MAFTDTDFHINTSRRVINRGRIYIGERQSDNPHSLRKTIKLYRFKPSKRKVHIELSTSEEYIAYRIKSFVTLIGKFDSRNRSKQYDEDDILEVEEYDLGYYYIEDENYDEMNYEDLRDNIFRLDFNKFTSKTFERVRRIFMREVRFIREQHDLVSRSHFQDLWDNLDLVKEEMAEEFKSFMRLLEHYTEESISIASENTNYKKDDADNKQNKYLKKSSDNIKNNLEVIQSLQYALARVDIGRSDKEIVKYVNKLWTSHYIKSREKTFKDIDIDVWIFGYITNMDEDLKKDLFQERQLKFIREVQNILNEYDIKKRLGNNIKLLVPNKREIAKMLGMDESNFKHKLSRIRKKVLGNLDKLIL